MIVNYREYQGSWSYEYIITDYEITIPLQGANANGGDSPEQLLTSLEISLLQTSNWSQGKIHNGAPSILIRNNGKWSYALDDGFTETKISRDQAIAFISQL